MKVSQQFCIDVTLYCPLDDLHSIVFYYGISTYFALPPTFPIAATTGMVWLSSIPKPRPTTMGLLRTSHHPLAFPYHPSILMLLWDCYGLQSTIPFPYHFHTLFAILTVEKHNKKLIMSMDHFPVVTKLPSLHMKVRLEFTLL